MSADENRKKDLSEKTREEIQDDLDNKRLGQPDSVKVAQANRRLSELDRIEANATAKKASNRSWAAILIAAGALIWNIAEWWITRPS